MAFDPSRMFALAYSSDVASVLRDSLTTLVFCMKSEPSCRFRKSATVSSGTVLAKESDGTFLQLEGMSMVKF